MSKFVSSLFFLIVLVLMGVSIVTAQGEVLEYGDVVEGEISNAEFELEYTFQGNAEDVIVIEMVPVDTMGDLDAPELVLLNSDNTVVADTTNNFDFGQAILVAELPADDIYVLLATREDGRAGESVGAFTLSLQLPEVIKADAIAEGNVTNEDRPAYYMVDSMDDFNLIYNKQDGDFFPQVTVFALGDDPGSVDEVAAASGSAMSTLNFGTFTGGEPYVVAVERALFDFSFDEIDADFTLQIAAP